MDIRIDVLIVTLIFIAGLEFWMENIIRNKGHKFYLLLGRYRNLSTFKKIIKEEQNSTQKQKYRILYSVDIISLLLFLLALISLAFK